jgi:hypothetical protein
MAVTCDYVAEREPRLMPSMNRGSRRSRVAELDGPAARRIRATESAQRLCAPYVIAISGTKGRYHYKRMCVTEQARTVSRCMVPARPSHRVDGCPYLCVIISVFGHAELFPAGLIRPLIANGAPMWGAVANPRHARLPSVHLFSVSQLRPNGLTWPDTPPAAGRAWVPGCRARTLRVRTTVLRRNR